MQGRWCFDGWCDYCATVCIWGICMPHMKTHIKIYKIYLINFEIRLVCFAWQIASVMNLDHHTSLGFLSAVLCCGLLSDAEAWIAWHNGYGQQQGQKESKPKDMYPESMRLLNRFIYTHQQLQEHCQTTANINIECSLTKCHFGQHEDPGYAFGAIPFLATTFVPWRNRMYPWTSLWYFWICNIPSKSWNAHIMVVCRYFYFLISPFTSIKDTYSLALAGEHFVTVPIIVPSFRKRFGICKNRLFSPSCLKDARIWNEGLGNNFKEAHVFCFHFFPLQSHMKTYP